MGQVKTRVTAHSASAPASRSLSGAGAVALALLWAPDILARVARALGKLHCPSARTSGPGHEAVFPSKGPGDAVTPCLRREHQGAHPPLRRETPSTLRLDKDSFLLGNGCLLMEAGTWTLFPFDPSCPCANSRPFYFIYFFDSRPFLKKKRDQLLN